MIKVAILGFGVVGSGVAEVLTLNSDKINRSTSADVSLKYILDLRDFPGNPFEKYIIHDFDIIESDPDVKIVVETIGGVGAAYEFSKRALKAGKSVVTSNKELVATHGVELMQLAYDNNVTYMFEASVGGGIPIIRPINQCLTADKINEIYGILNGTTNYILTAMFNNGTTFEDALKQAQELGYAERNPAADIEGHDACRKICILASLCFGRHVYPQYVETRGITDITAYDVEFAEKIGYKIKLVARCLFRGDKACAYVAPHLVSFDNPIANVTDVMNGIVVKGNAIGSVMFYGAGAGKMPTASAVSADVVDSVNMLNRPKSIPWTDGDAEMLDDPKKLSSKWYLRTEKTLEEFEEIGDNNGVKAYKTEVLTEEELLAKIECKGVLAYYRILD